MSRKNVNRKLRAKQGKIKNRLEYGRFYPRRTNTAKIMRKFATRYCFTLQHQAEETFMKDGGYAVMPRLEEHDARRVFANVPTVAQIIAQTQKGKSPSRPKHKII